MLKPRDPDWYRHAWSLDAQTQSWTEETEKQVDFVVGALGLTGRERTSIWPAVTGGTRFRWPGAGTR
jgi:hypothetical protein